MPPSFISRISRSSSGFTAAGPNHHQRIMIRASSGGCSNERFKATIVKDCADESDGLLVKRIASTTTDPMVTLVRIGLLRWQTGHAARLLDSHMAAIGGLNTSILKLPVLDVLNRSRSLCLDVDVSKDHVL